MITKSSPIGIYDSGVGGLTVWRAVRGLLPKEDLLYLADQANVPYGVRSLEEVRGLAEGVAKYLMGQGAKLIVIACNTASAAGLRYLRELYPDFPFVGMEPAVKPAAEQTLSGKVGVLATPSTFQGELYASVVERFAHDVRLYQATCPGLVRQIEKGYLDTLKTRRILLEALEPMLREGVDTLVMGCTHFPFVIPLIKEIAGEEVRVIDPAPAVARQVKRVLEARGLLAVRKRAGKSVFLTSGDALQLEVLLPNLVGVEVEVGGLRWKKGVLMKKKVKEPLGRLLPLPWPTPALAASLGSWEEVELDGGAIYIHREKGNGELEYRFNLPLDAWETPVILLEDNLGWVKEVALAKEPFTWYGSFVLTGEEREQFKEITEILIKVDEKGFY